MREAVYVCMLRFGSKTGEQCSERKVQLLPLQLSLCQPSTNSKPLLTHTTCTGLGSCAANLNLQGLLRGG